VQPCNSLDADRQVMTVCWLGYVRHSVTRYVLLHPDSIGNQILLHLPDNGPHAQSTLSQHLRQLREVDLLEGYTDGTAVCYRVNAARIAWLRDELQALE
jgi:ArsR family transcriptional regulator, arsenate/arsenite/antimonite-responsive transcriptional repressor